VVGVFGSEPLPVKRSLGKVISSSTKSRSVLLTFQDDFITIFYENAAKFPRRLKNVPHEQSPIWTSVL